MTPAAPLDVRRPELRCEAQDEFHDFIEMVAVDGRIFCRKCGEVRVVADPDRVRQPASSGEAP